MKKRAILLLLGVMLPVLAHATVTTQTFSVSYTCTGSTGPFPFAFPISEASAMVVTQNGVVLNPSAYTITPVNNNYTNGGSVTLIAACTSGQIALLRRETPLTQTSVFSENMPVPMKTIERGLDKLTEITQEQNASMSGVPFCQGFSPTEGQIVAYTTTSTPNPCWEAASNQGGAAGPYVPLSGGTMTGALFGPSVNNVVSACSFSGSTADVQINAAIASVSAGGTVDARCYGATSQTIAATVSTISGKTVTLDFSPSTLFQPASTTVQMFNLKNGAHVNGLHIDTTNQATYAATAVLVNDTITDHQNFSIHSLWVDGFGNFTAGSTCLEFLSDGTNSNAIAFTDINGFRCTALHDGILMEASGAGWVNGNNFQNIVLDGPVTPIEWEVSSPSAASTTVTGNSFANVQIQFSGSTTQGIYAHGASPGFINDNQVNGLQCWDQGANNCLNFADATVVSNYISGQIGNVISVGNNYWWDSLKGVSSPPIFMGNPVKVQGSTGATYDFDVKNAVGTTNNFLVNDNGEVQTPHVIIDDGSGNLNATTSVTTPALTDSGLTSGNCVQASTGGLLTTTGSACGSGGGGSPAGVSGNPQINAAGSFGADTNVFVAQSGDTIASIEAECSAACTYKSNIAQTFTLTANHTLSSNVNVIFGGHGSWTVNGATFTLTIPAKVGGTLTQHFVAGTGSVKLGNSNNLVPVEWFGAVGDGSTNNLATIQAAINALSYGQVELQMGGIYNIAGTLTYSKNNTGMTCSSPVSRGGSITGGAYSCAIIETTAGDDAIDVHGTSSVPIQYGTFSYIAIGSSVAQTGTAAGLSLSFTGGVTVRGLLSQDFFYPYYIHASPSYGNGGFFSNTATWTSLSSTLNTPIGFYLDSADGNAENSLTIHEGSVAQGGGPASCIGMMLYGTAVNDVNTYNFNVAGCNDGQDVNYTGTGATASASDIHFISTTVDSYHRHGMYFTATSTADAQAAGSSITVLDPRISAVSATDGINITNTSGVIVSAGQFLNYGILATGSTQLTLTGNTVQNAASQTPIGLTSTTYSTVSSNTVTNASGAAGTWGIYLGGTSSFDNVTSNNVTGYFNYYDIYTDTSTSNNTVVGNPVDPTHATLGGVGVNGAGNTVYNADATFPSSLDTTGLTTSTPAYRAIGALNFSGWNADSVTRAWGLGFVVPAGTAGTNPLFAYYNGTAWAEAWDINSSSGVLDAPNGVNVTGGSPGIGTPVLNINGTTFTASGCSNTTLIGGATAGSFDSGTTGTCTVTVTMGASVTAGHGFACYVNDITTPADVIHQTAFTTTTATFSGTTVSGDVLNFSCTGY